MNEKAVQNVVAFKAPGQQKAGGRLPIQILGHCRNLSTRHVEPLLREMLDNADDALFKLAEKAEDNRSQTAYFDAMRELRRQRSTMESEYATQMARVFDLCLRAKPGTPRASTVESDELSLVDEEELEENLAIDGMVGKARRLNEHDLQAIARRLAAVMEQSRLNEEDNPVDPIAFCRGFRDAMQVLDVDIRIRLIIFKLFDQFVVTRLGPLYHEINRYLVEMRILPDLRHESRGGGGGPEPRGGALGGSTADDADGAGAQEADGDDDEGDLVALLRHWVGRRGQGAAAQPRGRPGMMGPGAPGGSSGSGGAVDGHAGTVTADMGSVIAALSSLPSQGHMGVATGGAAELKGAVVGALNTGGDQTVALNGMDESAIDIVAMLFEFIFDDAALPAPIKELIGRLQIPVLKVALLDKSFFSRKRHPARRLLTELSRVGVGWSEAADEEEGLKVKIESLVERLLNDFEDDVGIFESVLEDLQTFCAQQAERAAQREEQAALATQGRENLLLARGVADEAIERVIDGRDLPEPVDHLLRHTWKELLVLIYLKNGQHSQLWQKALNVASLLVWSLIPKQRQDEREQLMGLLPSLLKALQDGMTRMARPPEEQQQVMALLAQEHTRMVKKPLPSEDAAALAPIEGLDPDEPMDPEEVKASAAPAAQAQAVNPVPAHGGGGPDPLLQPSAREAPPEGIPEDIHDGRSFMARKVAEINQLISEGRFSVPGQATPAWPEEEANGDDAVEDLHLMTARELAEGTWLELLDAENQPERIKLSWKSLISGKYFFVNRQGLKVREMTSHALAAEFRAGRARIIEDVPVFDRAIETLMSSLRAG
ncbi:MULTISPECIES: DUF1631 domain-containing protein [unclassified Ectothiorhodospira]|uniref:DUF1631 domain-containing protein n=1 Tax=unclassified Ectothiorhodospira TaxID=2684909 RepID=UPI001EE81380|nr:MULTISPECIES: DUF1631 domain-containing protein [unclassified Ectothiorhodospira]MCG5515703.1 DUF1631 domain-containing protein [Ectothiorhodospira sp. 9100]MCG5518513.1 DUF1631 domain-containing protein [Ectothiorhodospira sp. 9905]